MKFGTSELVQPEQDSEVQIVSPNDLGFFSEPKRGGRNSAPNPELRAPAKISRKSKQQQQDDSSAWNIELPALLINGEAIQLEINVKQAKEGYGLFSNKKKQLTWTALKK